MYYADKTAVCNDVDAPDSCKIYKECYLKNCKLGVNVTIGDRSRIIDTDVDEHVIIQRGNLIIGSNIGRYTSTMQNTTIFNAQIGKFCAISWGVSIGGAAHEYRNATIHGFISCKDFGLLDGTPPENTYDLYCKPCTIGNDVWIATGACINRGIKIGTGAVIGANAVVTHDVEPYTIVVGCPAKPINKRFKDDFIERLLVSNWWNLSSKTLSENINLFSKELDEEKLAKIESLCKKENIMQKHI